MFIVVYHNPFEGTEMERFETLEDAKSWIETETRGREIAEEIADNNRHPYHWYEVLEGEMPDDPTDVDAKFPETVYYSPYYWGV